MEETAINNFKLLYDKCGYGYLAHTNAMLLCFLKEYNKTLSEPYLASGQSHYYNKQVDEHGLTGLHFTQETIDDVNYIMEAFGKTPYAKKSEISILFTTLVGTTEFNYAMQSFPAFIFEDVFQCLPSHDLDLSPRVGEKEQDYFLRLMEHRINQSKTFDLTKKEECLNRTKKIINDFCGGKNRIYYINIKDILNNKCSFGDISAHRKRKLTIEEIQSEIAKLNTFEEQISGKSINLLYSDPNYTDEYGVAIYGDLSKCQVRYIEVDRAYDVLQKIAIALGCSENEEIPEEIMHGQVSQQDIYKILGPAVKELDIRYMSDYNIDINEIITYLSTEPISKYYDMFGRGKH